jgi:hypothetical protein
MQSNCGRASKSGFGIWMRTATVISALVLSPQLVSSAQDSWAISWSDDWAASMSLPQGLVGVKAIATGENQHAVVLESGAVVGWCTGSPCSFSDWLSNVSDATAVSVGVDHVLILRNNGEVFAIGNNEAGQTNVPAGLNNVVAVAAGSRHSLALKNDGTIISWGREGTTVPPEATNVIAISAGTLWNNPHFLALRSGGTVVAWGNGDFGDNIVPAGLSNVVAVSAGGNHSIALKSDGTVVCWGGEDDGIRTPPSDLTNAIAIAAGVYSHNLALRSDGTVTSWKSTKHSSGGAAVVPQGLRSVSAIAVSRYRSIAISTSQIPLLRVEPESQSVWASSEDAARFFSAAVGLDPLSFQWQKDGGNIAGATNRETWISPVQAAAEGDYRVIVSNVGGSVTSRVARLTVQPFLGIFQQPTNITAYEGASASFSVHAKGSDPIHYQWRRDNADVLGATNSTWVIETVQLSDASTNITVVVSNAAGLRLSMRATVKVLSNIYPAIVAQPQSQSVFIGGKVAFRVRATGRPILTYQWQKDGSDISGATSPELLIASVQSGDAGVYSVRISNDVGSTNSQAVTLDVRSWAFPSRPSGTVVSLGGPIVPIGLSNAVAVAAGNRHSVALKEDGTVRAWGGRLAESFGTTNVPPDLTNVVAISAGTYFTLALKADGTVTWWGMVTGSAEVYGITAISAAPNFGVGGFGLRVDGRVISLPDGSLVDGVTDVVSVSRGFLENLAVRSDGTVFAWGLYGNIFAWVSNAIQVAAGGGYFVLLDDGTLRDWPATGIPQGLTGVKEISANGSHALALKGDGTIASWGGNAPSVAGISNVVAISAGPSYSLVITTNPPQPALAAAADVNTQTILVTAPISVSGYVLETSDNLSSNYGTAVATGETNNGTLVIPNIGGMRFFRFRKP